MRVSWIVVAVALLTAGCATSRAGAGQTSALESEISTLKDRIAAIEGEIAEVRTESEALDERLATQTVDITQKLGARIRGSDQLYLEMDVEILGDLIRSFLEGYEGTGQACGQPFRYTLRNIRTRSHRERIFVSSTASVELGGSGCEESVSGYLLHLDRDLMKVRGFDLSCDTPGCHMEIPIGDGMEPMPMPVAFPREFDLVSKLGPMGSVELIVPVRAEISSDRLTLRAMNVSTRRVGP